MISNYMLFVITSVYLGYVMYQQWIPKITENQLKEAEHSVDDATDLASNC